MTIPGAGSKADRAREYPGKKRRDGSRIPLRPVLATVLLILADVTVLPAGADNSTGAVEHVVIVWLKDPGNSEQRQRIISESRVLTEIPGVTGLRAGRMIPSERAIVDSSFDVALIVSFSSQDALDSYLAHPLHVRLVDETLKPLVARIRVYDFR